MTERILVVVAHPDDEALGCAGTLLKHAARGDRIELVFMTNGVAARPHVDELSASERNLAAEKASRLMGAGTTYFDFPDNRMDSVALLDVVQSLEPIIQEYQPTSILTHHIGDLNVDHNVAHKAVLTACRPQPGSSVREILAFEVLSSTEWQSPGVQPFVPNLYVDISDFIDKKKAVLNCYQDEMRDEPHSRSIDNAIRLNGVRGNAVGVPFAEAFTTVRIIR